MRTHVVFQMIVPLYMGFTNEGKNFKNEKKDSKFRLRQKLKHDG